MNRCHFIFIIIPIITIIPELPLSFFSFAARDANEKKRLLNLSNLYATTSSIIFHVPASRISFRSDIHVEHTQPPTIGIAENESSLRRSLSLRALACTFPRMDACIWNAEETSRRRRTLQGDLTWVPWVLINRRGSISRVTKFHLSDSAARECVSLLCTRVSAWKHACVYHPRSLILRIAAACWRRLESRTIELSDNLECKSNRT